jgi:hypothetical protein
MPEAQIIETINSNIGAEGWVNLDIDVIAQAVDDVIHLCRAEVAPGLQILLIIRPT